MYTLRAMTVRLTDASVSFWPTPITSNDTITLPHFACTFVTLLSLLFSSFSMPNFIDSSNFALSAPVMKAVQLMAKDICIVMLGFPTNDMVDVLFVVGGTAVAISREIK